jgi:glycosyltransferase involved in cell wall biosynthesis
VVDNGSTDRTLDVVHSFAAPSIRIYQCPKQNASAARNLGTAKSAGTYIQYLDADDVLSPSKIDLQLSRLKGSEPRNMASGPWVRFERTLSERQIRPEGVWQDMDPQEFLILSWSGGGMMPNFGWLTPRHLIEEAGPWNESLTLNDDGEFFTRVILESTGVLFCQDAIGYYRSTSSPSLSKARSRKAFLSGFSSADQSAKHLLHVRDDKDARRGCAYHYQRFAYEAYPECADLAKLAEARAEELGGCDLAPSGGKLFQLLTPVIGWKKAKRLCAALPF